MNLKPYPWQGRAEPMSETAFDGAASEIGCEAAAIKAIWEVEAAGKPFLSDGSLIRRFEPHKMPGSPLTWRDSLKIKSPEREEMFLEAFTSTDQNDALRATSWGAPQIMGFNCIDAGYQSAESMVRSMADSEHAQLFAFTRLIFAWGLDSAIRAHDWRAFAARYNGNGQVDVYSRRIEAAYRRHSGGQKSPEVLRIGASGSAVKRLQSGLGITVDGHFGPETLEAVKVFQERVDLPVDGIVGKRTWSALEKAREVDPVPQQTTPDVLAAKGMDMLTKGGLGAGGGVIGTKLIERAPEGAIDLAFYLGVGLGFLVITGIVGAYAWRWVRKVA